MFRITRVSKLRARVTGELKTTTEVVYGITELAADGAVDIKVRQAVEQLSSSAREVVQLHYFSGLPHGEIGKILGITPGAVHGRLQRARRCLREWLSKNGEQEMNDE